MSMSLKSIVVLVAALSSGAVLAGDVLEKAKKAGLKPIPQEKAALFELIDNPQNRITDARVELGKQLYFDPRLSRSGLISCNTCHNLAIGGDDNVSVATGHKWTANPHHLNSPTVFNAVFNQKQFWDGRSPDLEDQATGPIQAAPEMHMTAKEAEQVVKSIPEYASAFAKAYPGEPITLKTIGKAIAAFERTLVTPSRYDDFLNGDEHALTVAEKKGLRTFIEVGCASCHGGINLGGGMAPFPAIKKYKFKYAHLGDFKGDKNGLVKVPTLRNITETAPYFHNGATHDLKEAIAIMGETQLGKRLHQSQIDSIATFLAALKGRKPQITYPVLPTETVDTPKPRLDH